MLHVQHPPTPKKGKHRLWNQTSQLSVSLNSVGTPLSQPYNGVVGLDDLLALRHTVLGFYSCWAALAPRPSSHILRRWLSAPHPSPSLPLRKLADCAQLLEVDDMVRLAVPDSKCVYTYIQELYRSLVQKGLVKTKKK